MSPGIEKSGGKHGVSTVESLISERSAVVEYVAYTTSGSEASLKNRSMMTELALDCRGDVFWSLERVASVMYGVTFNALSEPGLAS